LWLSNRSVSSPVEARITPAIPAHIAAAQLRAEAGSKLVLKGIGLNAFLAVLKFLGGIFGHSYALIADGTESLLDVLSSLLVWTGFRVASLPPDKDHPFGHGRAEPLSALAVAFFIFITAGIVAWHAIHYIVTPHLTPHWFTLPLLAAIILSKIRFARLTEAAGKKSRSTALGIEAWHHTSDAITSAAAFVGITIAVIGGKGWESADDWAALFACVVVVFNGIGMLKKALAEMMDEAVEPSYENAVRKVALAVNGVGALDKCRVRKSGLIHIVDIQIRVNGNLTVREGHDISHHVKDALINSDLGVTDVSVHVEPMPH